MRELRTALRYALVMSEGADVLDVAHLPPAPAGAPARPSSPPASAGRSMNDAEGDVLRRALADTNGNLTAAARVLGVARSTLYRMMGRHGITPP